ncbi:MAG: YitT family protein [Clostridia bacterium]|nr:YitT family protein [Clostridia bacterium]
MKKSKSLKKNLNIKTVITDNIYFVIGCALYSFGVNIFAIPNNIAQSGITGVAIIINYLFPQCPVGLTGFILNIPLIILAWIFIGKAFTLKTLWVTTILSAEIDIAAKLIDRFNISLYNGDKLLAALFCGAMCGAGIALIIVRGATSGGTDVLGRLLKKIWPHMTMGTMILVCDTAVVLAAAIVFRSVDSAMYAAILIFASSEVMDRILYGSGNGKMLYIFTDKGEEISQYIVKHSRRGVTVLDGKGAYTGESKNLLICVARSHEIPKLRRYVKEIDPESFVVLTEANEILGKGFNPPAANDG